MFELHVLHEIDLKEIPIPNSIVNENWPNVDIMGECFPAVRIRKVSLFKNLECKT